jgi:hypothetical protein
MQAATNYYTTYMLQTYILLATGTARPPDADPSALPQVGSTHAHTLSSEQCA